MEVRSSNLEVKVRALQNKVEMLVSEAKAFKSELKSNITCYLLLKYMLSSSNSISRLKKKKWLFQKLVILLCQISYSLIIKYILEGSTMKRNTTQGYKNSLAFRKNSRIT